MSNNTKPQLMIDGVEYDVEKMTDKQKALLDHVVDLERKVNSARFNLDQLSIGRDTFFNLLKQALTETPSESTDKVEDAKIVG